MSRQHYLLRPSAFAALTALGATLRTAARLLRAIFAPARLLRAALAAACLLPATPAAAQEIIELPGEDRMLELEVE